MITFLLLLASIHLVLCNIEFSTPAKGIYTSNYITYNEQDIITKDGDSLRPDRLSLKNKKEVINSAKELMESWGLKVLIGQNVFNQNFHFAGTDEESGELNADDKETVSQENEVNVAEVSSPSQGNF